MVINLTPGDELIVQFDGTDGEFRIHFDSRTHPNAIVVEETSGFPDSEGRDGTLYKEVFDDKNIVG